MTITLMRKSFSADERKFLTDKIMNGIRADDLGCDLDTADELDSMAIKIADELPRLLKMAGLPDTSDNRRRMIDLVIARYSMPKNAPSKMFYKFATRWRPKRR